MTDDHAESQLNYEMTQLADSLAEREEAHPRAVATWKQGTQTCLKIVRRMDFDRLEATRSELDNRVRLRVERLVTEFSSKGLTTQHMINGEPEDVIPRVIRDEAIDPLAIGTIGRTGVPGVFIGNTAERVPATRLTVR